jgi:hypothetical protein
MSIAYGFTDKEYLFAQMLSQVGERDVFDMVTESARIHSAVLNQMLGGLAERTTDHKLRIHLPGSGTLQPQQDGFALPQRVKDAGTYDVALPIQGGMTGFGLDRISKNIATVGKVNQLTVDRIGEDADWMKRHMLAALFDNAAWTFTDQTYGALTIQPLAITSDSVTYNFRDGSTATDQHYNYQTAAIADATNPYPTIHTELKEHPSNTGDVVCFIPTGLKTATEALTDFVPVADARLRYGANVTLVDEGFVNQVKMFGDEVLGRTDECWIVEWMSMPANYILSVCMGTSRKVLGMREYPAAALQGFTLVTKDGEPAANLLDCYAYRDCGFGVLNRIAACVTEVSSGDAAYTIPTGYDAPLAI